MIRLLIKIIRTLTLDRIAIFGLTAFLAIALITVWENREKLGQLSEPKIPIKQTTWLVSDKTQKMLKEYVQTTDGVVSVLVTSADLRFNEARPVFFFSTDSVVAISGLFDPGSEFSRFPIFTGSESINSEAIKLINGEFHCVPFKQTVFSVISPELDDRITTVCKTSIPSYYGYFSGSIAFFLTYTPSPEKQSILKLQLEKFGNHIYFNDTLQTQRLEEVIR